ncbi:DUF6506 family protein [Anaerovorax odorimutans]|uniref:DUF6506 family protein n=1 Tax=Anaerovorax odorimutans TaxID=109327 RepID=A0ABT1RKK0_9FIRM|nr:DUF6506 family protein [Anaerovorax odorimutans]MCQ4635693.1 DUF6506 family protein [Anaerovorax odorimutans]
MFKFAFIENVPGSSPENYSFVYENDESYSLVTGTSSFEMTEELIKKLDKEGYDLIDLCGDFGEEAAAKLEESVTGKMEITYADYLPDELAKIEALDSLKEYGIVIVMDGVEETQKFSLKSEECNTYVHFVKDLDAAKVAAKELVEQQGVYFLELCSYFDKKETLEVIAAIEGKVPVGSCGDLK